MCRFICHFDEYLFSAVSDGQRSKCAGNFTSQAVQIPIQMRLLVWWICVRSFKSNDLKREISPPIFFSHNEINFHWIYFIIKIGIFCLCNKCLKRKMLEIWNPLKLVTSFQFESNWIVHDILEMYDRFFSRSFCAAFSAACRSISYDSLINHQRSISFDLSAFFIFYLYLSRCINGPYPGSGSPMKCKCTHTHIQCATKRVKNVLFIHNSMQFHTFFPCGAIPTGSLALWYKPSHPFAHSLSHHKFSTRIIARIHVCLYGHALNVIIFHIRAISHRAIMNWSQIIIHS